MWNFIGQVESRRAFFIRVSKNADAIELDILDETHQLLKIIFSLTGKSGNERRPHRDTGNSLSHTFDQPFETLAIAAAFHQFQNVLRSVLQRHVEILHGFRLFGKHVEKTVADMRRIRVHHAHPLDAVGV